MSREKEKKSGANFHYIRLADEMQGKIQGGEYKAGEKLPSIRRLHRQLGLSISTVYQAYIELEKRGTVARPGDTILVESPTFHGFLQLIEDLNMYALEVPTHPETGIDPRLLERAVMGNRVHACLLTPNFQNPVGALMPDENKASKSWPGS